MRTNTYEGRRDDKARTIARKTARRLKAQGVIL